MNDVIARIAMGVLILAFFVVRARNHRKAETEGGKIEYREKNALLIRLIRGIGGLGLLASLAIYFVKPEWLAWAALLMPGWLRWAGVVIGYGSLPLIWWTEFSLGKNFNTTLHVREGHTLVTHGPYRWVRHPMYTGLFALTVGWLLISANALVGLPGLIGLTAIVVNRVGREEQVMIEQFGDVYRAYMRSTGRFFPRLVRPTG